MKALQDSGQQWVSLQKTSQSLATLIFEGKSIQQTLTGIDLAHSEMIKERLALIDGSWDNLSWPNAIIISQSIAKSSMYYQVIQLLHSCRLSQVKTMSANSALQRLLSIQVLSVL